MNNNVEKLLNEIGKLVVAQNERTKERYSHGELFNVFNILGFESKEVRLHSALLAELLREAAKYRANILTIHQSIPINGIATLTLSIEILSTTGNISEMVDEMEENEGVHYLKIVGRE